MHLQNHTVENNEGIYGLYIIDFDNNILESLRGCVNSIFET